ncbi:unnamed protein product [Spirodela intermedia]|uniref:Uncharacterized protein n=2 Tax=Spirodela intermedia TaxID=51605 RepID=A0A7I8IJK4_SPIIN|nr:unnamed protein product [Spirodela intermedia]CAA6657328.1 unnamed protein product [Spirodela intermedia]CAA7393377.1 unnamed protein product [Spirodela intermedia]
MWHSEELLQREMGEKALLRSLARSAEFLLQKLEEDGPAATPSLRGPWIAAVSILLAVVLFVVGLMYYVYRCGCSNSKTKRMQADV